MYRTHARTHECLTAFRPHASYRIWYQSWYIVYTTDASEMRHRCLLSRLRGRSKVLLNRIYPKNWIAIPYFYNMKKIILESSFIYGTFQLQIGCLYDEPTIGIDIFDLILIFLSSYTL